MYCYKFPDKDTFISKCIELGWATAPTEEEPESVLSAYTHQYAIDNIGTLSIPPVATLQEGEDLETMTKQNLLDWALSWGVDLVDSQLKSEIKAQCYELLEPTVLDGHHVNYVGDLPESWNDYLVVVNSPSRQFAGSSGPSLDPFVDSE